jgi:kumamolisin
MIHSRRARLSAGIVLGVAAVIAPLAASSGPASASGPGPNTPTQVQAGINVASLPGVTVFPGVPADTPETVSFILREQNLPQLESQVEAGVRNYLSVSQFARIYGQSQANISALTSYLASFGISTDVYADNVDVSTTGTAGEYNQALSVSQNWYQVPQQPGRGGLGPIPAQRVHGNTGPPLLPYRLAKFVLAILGLTNYGPYASQVMHADTSLAQPQSGSSNFCLALTGLPDACHLPQDFASGYNLDGLYQRGADGAGQTLGIVTLAALDPGAPEYFWANVAHIKRTGTLTVQNIDGGPGAPSWDAGTLETDIDAEQSGGVAPGANVIVYQAPNTDFGWADAFFTAASQNTAGTVSTSWGESETALLATILSGQEAATFQQAFDEAFLELAVQGQSAFDASGDTGAYAAFRDIGTTNLSVQSVSNSPYVTAAGGTTLPWTGTFTGPEGSATITVPQQRIWGWDYLWQPIAQITGEPESTVAESAIGGSVGGFSTLERTPSYQQAVPGTHDFHAVQYLTPTNYQTIVPGLVEPTAWNFNPAPNVTTGYGTGRAVPDVSTNADPETGYLVYAPSASQVDEPALQGAWGGTSFVAPQLNGSTAVIDSYLGHRVGFWNPVIYAAALSGNSPFTPLDQAGTSNDNLYYSGNPGQPYNQGAGLGYPNLTDLARFFP